MRKIRLELDSIAGAFPEAALIPHLPRKKKKALKKKISKMLITLLEKDAQQILERALEMEVNMHEDFAIIKGMLNNLEDEDIQE